MNILDTSALDHMVKQKVLPAGFCCVSPDVLDEYESWHEQKLPKNVHNVCDLDGFDEALYLRNYRLMLNKHRGRSFYNMTGFGDISILALIATQKELDKIRLPLDQLVVITNDGPLGKKIEKEFGKTILLLTPDNFF